MPADLPEDAMPSAEGADELGAMSYEDAVAELESIIDRIESGEIGLEDSVAAYERGAALVKRCRAILDRAEQRIEELDARAGAERPSPGEA